MMEQADAILITGAGLVTGLGLSRQDVWRNILSGGCAFRPLRAIESPTPADADGGEAVDLPADFLPQSPREVRYLKWAIDDALRDAGAAPELPCSADRCACVLGTTLHGMRGAGRFLRGNDYAQLRDFLAGQTLRLASAGARLGGWSATTCSACSSSLASIALGVTLLQAREADLVIAGGYDAIGEYVYGGFNSLRLIARGPVRPFARGREGMKLAEGFGIVVLERAADAHRRGADALATVMGWGESADSHHLTQPDPAGDGAARAMLQALSRAQVSAADIDLIAAHATGTVDNDASEYAAFRRVFGERLREVPVVAYKSRLGHTLGGAGAVELILSAMALREQMTPTCANVDATMVEFPGLRVATGEPAKANLRATLNTSLGFGGANACIILGPPAPIRTTDACRGPWSPSAAPGEVRAVSAARDTAQTTYSSAASGGHACAAIEACITGIGIAFPDIIGIDALRARLSAESPPAWRRDTGPVQEQQFLHLLNARRIRRMSEYVKLTLAATTLACRDAGIQDPAAFASDCSALLGTMHGSSNFSVEYYSAIVSGGLVAANPSLFAEGVPNAGAAQLSLMLGIKGGCQTLIGTRTAGLDALAMAALRIRHGDWDRAIVSAGEEYCPVVCEAHRRCRNAVAEGHAPFASDAGCVMGAGAVTLIIESRQAVERRGGRARAAVEAFKAARDAPAHAAATVGRVLEQLGQPQNVLSSACGGWVDRAEACAIARSPGARMVSSIYGYAAETFSASPLLGIASVLCAGSFPRLLGSGWRSDTGVRAAIGGEPVESFAAICTDFSGASVGTRVRLMS